MGPCIYPDPKFLALLNLNFLARKPKNLNFPKSFLACYPQPKLNQNCPKDLKSILPWPYNCCTHTFGKPYLLVLWFGLLWFGSLFQAISNLATLLKSPENHVQFFEKEIPNQFPSFNQLLPSSNTWLSDILPILCREAETNSKRPKRCKI